MVTPTQQPVQEGERTIFCLSTDNTLERDTPISKPSFSLLEFYVDMNDYDHISRTTQRMLAEGVVANMREIQEWFRKNRPLMYIFAISEQQAYKSPLLKRDAYYLSEGFVPRGKDYKRTPYFASYFSSSIGSINLFFVSQPRSGYRFRTTARSLAIFFIHLSARFWSRE